MTYSRLQNPTVAMLEERIAAMEGSEACRVQASGMAAMTVALLCQLSQGEYPVGELESLLGIGQPTLSQQLAVLREEQLVGTRREGKQIFYRIDSNEALAILQVLYQQFCLPSQGVTS